jgi:hypothetical protein
VLISRAGAEALDRLEPLWLSLHRHHQAVGGPALEPYVDDAQSWASRRAMYAGFLAAPHSSFVLLAERGAALLGYAMVALSPVEDTWVDDTWRTGPVIAEIVGAFAANTGALALYERRGFRPTWNYLSRFAGRQAS